MCISVLTTVGLALGIVFALQTYVPASVWELPLAAGFFLAGAGLTIFGGRRLAHPGSFDVTRYPGLLRVLLVGCAILLCILVSTDLVGTVAAALMGETIWAQLISGLPTLGIVVLLSHYFEVRQRNWRRMLAEIAAELEQELREQTTAQEDETPHDDDAPSAP